jgi:hypothetical protein
MAVYTANDSYNQQLSGGSEADTFYAGRNSVIITSGGGGDTIVYQHLPWNSTGHIRDFALGVDKLDFSALFSASGYTGSDPVRDGYLRFESDGDGGTRLWYDPDASGTTYQWPTLITTLDNISPTGLTWAQLSNPTPPPPRERIATTDGGYVELWYTNNGRDFHLQKYNAAGTPVGAEYSTWTTADVEVVALSDGGYAVSYGKGQSHSFVALAALFDAAGAVERAEWMVSDNAFTGDIAASPHGGFLITSLGNSGLSGGPEVHRDDVTLYDNSGVRVLQTQVTGFPAPTIEVLSDGTYRLSWNDNGAARTLNIDPRNPPDLSPPATPQVSINDDVSPQTGTFSVEDSAGPTWTNDTSIALRVTVTEQGELDLWWGAGFAGQRQPDMTLAITAEDVARGYKDVPVSLSAGETSYDGYARITDVNGVISGTTGLGLNVDTVTPPNPSITNVTDDQGPNTGDVPRGGSTDDTRPTVQIAYTPSGTDYDNDRIQLYVDGSPAGAPVTASFDDAARGYVVITSPTLSDGTHNISATMTDGAGNVSPLAASYTITVQSGGNSPPVATIGDHSLGINGSAQIQSWISYSDADGNAATQYQFWDQGIAANSGYFSTPSNAHHPSETVITVNAADLANVLVHGGQVAGSENLWVRAFDGTAWSQWDAFNFTTLANRPPVATVSDHSLAANQWAQVQGWISYSDADGNAATQYQFWDQGIAANSAYFWTPSNPHHPSETLITVNAADLANVWVRGGQVTGSENLWVRAFDGTAWSAWDSWNMSTFA